MWYRLRGNIHWQKKSLQTSKGNKMSVHLCSTCSEKKKIGTFVVFSVSCDVADLHVGRSLASHLWICTDYSIHSVSSVYLPGTHSTKWRSGAAGIQTRKVLEEGQMFPHWLSGQSETQSDLVISRSNSYFFNRATDRESYLKDCGYITSPADLSCSWLFPFVWFFNRACVNRFWTQRLKMPVRRGSASESGSC